MITHSDLVRAVSRTFALSIERLPGLLGEALAVATINLAQTADWDRWRLRLDPIWR